MRPTIEAAIITGCFGIVTVAGTVIAQLIGFRSTRARHSLHFSLTSSFARPLSGSSRRIFKRGSRGRSSFLHARNYGAEVTFFAAHRAGGVVDVDDVDISDGQLGTG